MKHGVISGGKMRSNKKKNFGNLKMRAAMRNLAEGCETMLEELSGR